MQRKPKAYVRSNLPMGYYASKAKKTNQGNKGGPYFWKDGSWQYAAFADGHWTDKAELIATLTHHGFEVVDETK